MPSGATPEFIPILFRIVIDRVFLKECNKLFLKAVVPVMLSLPFAGVNCEGPLRNAHSESAVPSCQENPLP
jgi:hypothetical protein